MTRRFHILLFLLCILAVAIGCGKKPAKENSNPPSENISTVTKDGPVKNTNKKNNSKDSAVFVEVKIALDTTEIHIDTILSFLNCKLVVTHEKFDVNHKRLSMDDMYYNPLTIYLLDSKNDSIIYKGKYEENVFDRILTFDNAGVNPSSFSYVALMTFGGGSGYLINWYRFSANSTPYFTKICTYNELASYEFSKDGKELLVLQGDWNFNEDETHFEEHRYEILKYNLQKPGTASISEGTTRHKYPSIFEGQGGRPSAILIKMIKEKEPEVLSQIDFSKYTFE